MVEQSTNRQIPPEEQLKRTIEAKGVVYHHWDPAREGVIIAVAELWPGILDGVVYFMGNKPPDLTKRQSLLGRDEFDTFSTTLVRLSGLENLPPITSILKAGFAGWDSEEMKQHRISLLRESCHALIRDLEEIGIRELDS